ncbi:glycoside hydrolase family 3 protein [Listeria ilorinensis]|uniref:glycoside hydrolase family 3 protein n=1 Tax=Listeria ilorinensis TaxID=2867439 RepID=UPI001EF5460C|nr:glycoside hydrolase family 3 N-terminal domain-containing protein [Listeria ilorinensis]
MRKVDLTANPYFLDENGINWVETTLQEMDDDAKIKQLFAPIVMSTNKSEAVEWVKKYQPAGLMYRPEAKEALQDVFRAMQQHSDVPLLIAANLEAGGNGLVNEGTYVGRQLQIAATDDEEYAYQLGRICGKEAEALGCNWAFAPVIDIDYNFRNPITNVRTYGNDPERVLRMGRAYKHGFDESHGAVSIKHFPGDGVDDRDQHLHVTYNRLSVNEWQNSYGKVYRGLIEEGAHTVMIGHIAFPEYSRAKGISDEKIRPATLAPELMGDLLRDELGFNGMIVTDASVMGGFTMLEKREFAVPYSIAAGADCFLFNRDLDEDIMYMKKGIENGILTMERVNDAVRRILGVKASLGLHQKAELVPGKAALDIVGCEEHQAIARAAADKGITLVKDTQKLLPIDPQEKRRVYMQAVGVEEDTPIYQYLLKKLTDAGFEVDAKPVHNWGFKDMSISVEQIKQQYDLAIFYANEATMSNRTQVRINWGMLGFNIPWFIEELPTMFISTANPYHLIDVPHIKTFINGYSDSEYVVDAIIEKILGRSPFVGINPIDPYCDGRFELKL